MGWRSFRPHAKEVSIGETDITGRISKTGDTGVRAVLFEAAHIILTRPLKAGALKSWALKLSKRAGMKKAKVALARKLAVILLRCGGIRPHSMPPRRARHKTVQRIFERALTPALPKAKSQCRDGG